MAEYCNECWNEINGERIFEGELKLTKQDEKCKKCGKKEPLVIRKYNRIERFFRLPYLMIGCYIAGVRLNLHLWKSAGKTRKKLANKYCCKCWREKYLINYAPYYLKFTKKLGECEKCGVRTFLVMGRKNLLMCMIEKKFGNLYRKILYWHTERWFKKIERKLTKKK